MTKDDALKLALEALEASAPWVELTNEAITNDKAIADIKEALAQPAQEPVAWQWLGSAHFRKKLPKNADITAWNPIYTAPPQPAQEPVGKVTEITDNGFKCEFRQRLTAGTKLYAAPPPQRPWVDLTELEKAEITSLKWWDWEDTFDIEGFIQAIEAKLKEKNT